MRHTLAMRHWVIRALCLAMLAVPGLSRADFATPCRLSGVNGTYEVARLVLPGGSSVGSFGASASNPDKVPFTDRQSYISMVGFYVIDATTHALKLWWLEWGGAGAPGTKVRVNGTDYYPRSPSDPEIPTTAWSGGQGSQNAYIESPLPAGTYYVIGFGYGASSGALGQGTWWGTINTGVNCTQLSVPGQIRRYNQTDFTGPTHIYASGLYGSGQGLSLAVPVSRNTVLGGMYARADFVTGGGSDPVGRMQLRYWYPGRPLTGPPNGEIGTVNHTGARPFVSTSGTYNYKVDYYGFEPLADITFLELDLP